MFQLPNTLDDAIASAKEATQACLNDGYNRVQVELVFPEIALQAQYIAQQFIPLFEEYGSGLKLLFPDAGAAALARRDWGEVPFKVADIGSSRVPVETKVDPDDEVFLLVCPSAVEVNRVEKICNLAGDRPCLLLIPQLEDVSIVGIGYAARQLRERFLSTIETSYYLKPLNGAALKRAYPLPWQVFLEKEGQYQLIAEEPRKPVGEGLELILRQATSPTPTAEGQANQAPMPKKPGLFSSLQRFLDALSR